MLKIIIAASGLFCFSLVASAQTEIGAEYQHGFGKNYHDNYLGGLYEGFASTGKSSWQVGLSYTFNSISAEKKTYGRSGLAISAGYRYGFSYGTSGNLVTGVRTTFSFAKGLESERHSTFTPSLEFGYHYTFNNFGKGGFTTPSLGLGYNIKMSGDEETKENEEGPLFLIRLGAGYRF